VIIPRGNRCAVGLALPLVVVLVAPAAAMAQRTAAPAATAARRAAPLAIAIVPGFETLDDGSTRLFVDLSAPVSFETKSAKGSITYILRGTQVGRRNNSNPLVTTFFNTPVTKAQLVSHGHDLWFVVALRASVEPTVSVDPKEEGGTTLSIHFPKGDYLPATPPPGEGVATTPVYDVPGPMAPASPAAPAPRVPPASRSHARGAGGGSQRHGGGASGQVQ
jgi:hypothetical protein